MNNDIKSAINLATKFDLDGLKNDFPTATELVKFVYDETGVSLNLKGRSNDFKYSIALAVLNGEDIPPEALSSANPYVDKNDLVPVDAIRTLPERSRDLPNVNQAQHICHFGMPHPDPAEAQQDRKVEICFRKYRDGSITYQITGPMEQRSVGSAIDKYGRTRPERIQWDDPRTPEQYLRKGYSNYTDKGATLQSYLSSRKYWSMIDRDTMGAQQSVLENPWG